MSEFHEAAERWSTDVHAAAAKLLESGAAPNPSEALRQAQDNVRRQRAAASTATVSTAELQELHRSFDAGGPIG